MAASRARVLIAAPPYVSRQLAAPVREEVEVAAAATLEEATAKLAEHDPHLIVVCYVFDEMRPFRFIQYVRLELSVRHMPIILVRALPVALGATQEAEIRASYRTLGVSEFVNLSDESRRHGWHAALERFGRVVFEHLELGPTPPSRSLMDRDA